MVKDHCNSLHTAISSMEGICQIEFVFFHFHTLLSHHLFPTQRNKKQQRKLITFVKKLQNRLNFMSDHHSLSLPSQSI